MERWLTQRVVGIATLALLIGCVNPIKQGTLAPNDAVKACLDTVTASFEHDGHYQATLRIAEAANIDAGLTYALAYYSQYPDTDLSYNAVNQAFKFWRPAWRKAILSELHSLHNGDDTAIQQRRGALIAALYATLESIPEQVDSTWKAGLLIHALGDAYAHTQGSIGREQAYGSCIGHAIPSLLGKSPDKIKRPAVKPKMKAYAEVLYALLAREGTGNEEELKRFLKEIDACDDSSCNFQGQRSTCTTTSDPFKKFESCMNVTARKLSPNDILSVTKDILRLESSATLQSTPVK